MYITQTALDDVVLFKLFEVAQIDDRSLDKTQISELFDLKISPKRVELSLENLLRQSMIVGYDEAYSISRQGYRLVEEKLGQDDSRIRNYFQYGDEWLAAQTIASGGAPASDRIVSRSHNQAQVDELVDGLIGLESEIEKSNEVGAELGEDKDIILGEIAATKTLTAAPNFRLQRLLSLIVPALKFIAEKFSGSALSEAAKQLIKLIFSLDS